MDGVSAEPETARPHAGPAGKGAVGRPSALQGVPAQGDDRPRDVHVRRSESLRQPVADVDARAQARNCRAGSATTATATAPTTAAATAAACRTESRAGSRAAAADDASAGRSEARAVLLRRDGRQGSP